MGRKWVYKPGHPKANERGFVAWEDYGGGVDIRAVDAPILAGRFYENTAATDGTDIGSRRKHRDYMKATGTAPSGDFSPEWYANRRAEVDREEKKDRRETLERAWWNTFQK